MRREVPERGLFGVGICIYSDAENGPVCYFRHAEGSAEGGDGDIKGGRVRRSEGLARR